MNAMVLKLGNPTGLEFPYFSNISRYNNVIQEACFHRVMEMGPIVSS